MPQEHSAGAIIFRLEGTTPFYLLLHYPSSARAKNDYWDFPKGRRERGESEEETIRREVFEETGLKDIQFLEGFRETIRYFFRLEGKTVFKTVVFYLAKTNKESVKISSEHIGYQWLPFQKALQQLKFSNAKRILKKAHQFLQSKSLV